MIRDNGNSAKSNITVSKFVYVTSLFSLVNFTCMLIFVPSVFRDLLRDVRATSKLNRDVYLYRVLQKSCPKFNVA